MGNWKYKLKKIAKDILPVNTVRKIRAGKNRRLIQKMAAHRRIPYDGDAFREGINLIGCFRLKTGLGQGCRLTRVQRKGCKRRERI